MRRLFFLSLGGQADHGQPAHGGLNSTKHARGRAASLPQGAPGAILREGAWAAGRELEIAAGLGLCPATTSRFSTQMMDRDLDENALGGRSERLPALQISPDLATSEAPNTVVTERLATSPNAVRARVPGALALWWVCQPLLDLPLPFHLLPVMLAHEQQEEHGRYDRAPC